MKLNTKNLGNYIIKRIGSRERLPVIDVRDSMSS